MYLSVNQQRNDFQIKDERLEKYTGSNSVVVVPEGVTSIDEVAFRRDIDAGRGWSSKLDYGNDFLKSIALPTGITCIEDRTFKNCEKLENVVFPDGLKSIGREAFYNCKKLKTIVLPDSLEEIEKDAFNGCTNLKTIVLSNSHLTKIGDTAFGVYYPKMSISAVYITDLAAWCNIKFGDSANPLHWGAKLYLNKQLVSNLVIPSEVTAIKGGAFTGCAIKSLVIHDGVTEIGSDVFRSCNNLAEVTIKGNAESGVTKIGTGAFWECKNMKTIKLPKSLKEIGKSAFLNCYKLQVIQYGGTEDQWDEISKGDSWCSCVHKRCRIECADS